MDKTSIASTLQVVDFFPFLRPLYRIIPPRLSLFKKRLQDITKIEDRLFLKLMDDAKEKIRQGKVYPSKVPPEGFDAAGAIG